MKNIDKLKKLLISTLNIQDIDKITDEMGPDEIKDWDSLAHIELVAGLEDKFEISIDVIDTSRMYTIGDIKKILGKYGVEI
ncbi:acyl carrier protein [Clostridium sp.]|uniref:acyl carrier protein n=1 Tax=Clostridium sp. TaxID=1506 RepID=UPI00258A413D|nr:acyl carrier protein [Clostridium sp.]MDF2502912.1 acyl carrier protein [Clostridium sp.]